MQVRLSRFLKWTWKSFPVSDFCFRRIRELYPYIPIAILKETTSDGMSSMVVLNGNIQINKIYVQVNFMFRYSSKIYVQVNYNAQVKYMFLWIPETCWLYFIRNNSFHITQLWALQGYAIVTFLIYL